MSSTARVLYDEETGLFCVATLSGETRPGLSKAEAHGLADAVNAGTLNPAQLNDVSARAYVLSGQSKAWDNSTPSGTSAQKG